MGDEFDSNFTKIMVFSDLDGSFLEPKTYSFKHAKRGLRELRVKNIVPVFVSSKTCKEISSLQEISGLYGPLICENGAAIFDNNLAGSSLIKVFGKPRKLWLQDLISGKLYFNIQEQLSLSAYQVLWISN